MNTDEKLDLILSQLVTMKSDIDKLQNKVKEGFSRIDLVLEKDMKLLTHVVSEHSGMLNKLSLQ